MKFLANSSSITIENGGPPLIVSMGQWLLLEPEFEGDPAADFEQWSPELHYIVANGDQKAAGLPSRQGYCEAIDSYRTQLGVELPPDNPATLPPDPLGAITVALTPGTPEFEVFSWIRQQSNTSALIGNARSDLNMNLTMLTSWHRTPLMMAYGLTAAWGNLAAAAAAEGLTMPEGWDAKVAAWRETFRLAVPVTPEGPP